MPRMHSCSFCRRKFPHGTGMMYVKNDGTIYWFCSRKCRVSMLELGRDARKLKWTERYARSAR